MCCWRGAAKLSQKWLCLRWTLRSTGLGARDPVCLRRTAATTRYCQPRAPAAARYRSVTQRDHNGGRERQHTATGAAAGATQPTCTARPLSTRAARVNGTTLYLEQKLLSLQKKSVAAGFYFSVRIMKDEILFR